MVASFTPLKPTVGLVRGFLAMETHFMKLPMNSYCAEVASRGSLELGSECCNRGQMILELNHLAIVAPRRFHFTITALTVNREVLAGQKFTVTYDRGSSGRAEI
jgi:hypothetical protein